MTMTSKRPKTKAPLPSSHGIDQHGRERIAAIATEMVTARIARGEVELTDEAVDEATRQAVVDAREAYLAALDFISK